MVALLNVYNTFLVSVFSIVIAISAINYWFIKKKDYLFILILYVAFIADLIVISLTENSPVFANMYDSRFLMQPSWKTLVYVVVFGSLILLNEALLKADFKVLKVALVVLIVYLLFIPLTEDSPMKSWLYYEPNQIYMFVFGAYVLNYIRKKKAELDETVEKMLKRFAKIFMFFSVLILVEDTYVIFFVDNYQNTVYINNRSVTEDIFRFVLACFILNYEFRYLDQYVESRAKESVLSQTVPAYVGERRGTEEDDYSKFYLFCRKYQFTVREQEILELMMAGKNSQEIADALSISVGTAKTHSHNIFFKAGVSKKSMLFKLYNDFCDEKEVV
ncbi:MAG: helix-turn-helix transcriptional regulator [Lachnospiraceae bacterium]|nr:helix-turn-helix transcriptional regulator [Lachnospiraceae bacterium]